MTELQSLGPWQDDFPLDRDGRIAEGLVIWSQSRAIEGRTTGSRRRCITTHCPGWQIGVRWETGQIMFICSKGWRYDPPTNSIGVVAGGEISARFVAPKPLGTDPLPRNEWPARSTLERYRGWRCVTLT